MAATITAESIRRAPKVLLHDHLDGGLRPTTVIELADAAGHELPTTDPAELQAYFVRGAEARDIIRYLETFQHTVGVMQTEDALARVAQECVQDLAADGVVYAEVRFAPELHQQRGLALPAVVEAVLDGLRRSMASASVDGTPVEVNVILCAMRTETRASEIVRLLDQMRGAHPELVGFDLAGAETGYPPSLHAEALRYARERGINLTIHASEPPDIELIEDAVRHGAQRIGHGVRITSDITTQGGADVLGSVAQRVRDDRIALEMAPSCHVQIGAVTSFDAHPFVRLMRLGFAVTVNTDNRLMSNVSVTSETVALAETFDLGWDDLEQIAVNGAQAAFVPDERRRRLVDDVIRPAYARLRASG